MKYEFYSKVRDNDTLRESFNELTRRTFGFDFVGFLFGGQLSVMSRIVFALVGLAWAAINVNSLPMVVEMCKGSDIGKFTGFYYTASMSAQIITPVLSGFLMDKMGMTILFPYAAIFVALALVTMFLVRHGDSKVATRNGLEVFNNED